MASTKVLDRRRNRGEFAYMSAVLDDMSHGSVKAYNRCCIHSEGRRGHITYSKVSILQKNYNLAE